MMKKAYQKDIWRSIQRGWKRFVSILIITALGVAMLTGLYASCMDMYYSADKFYDRQNLFDIRVLSPMGLTEGDVTTLSKVNGVEAVDGAFSQTVETDIGGVGKSAEMTVLSSKGLNAPYILEGTLPVQEKEIAVTQKYLDESGAALGGTVTVGDRSYTITAVVMNPLNIQSTGMASVFRANVTTDYTFFIAAADAAANGIYTAVYLTVAGTKELNTFSEEYERVVETVLGEIEGLIKKEREQGSSGPAAQWYAQDRTSLDSYSSMINDLSSIEAVGKVFPVIFLLVAVLMSLTSMTRMVEEERGLIGTYKALGFGNGAVYRKYILFALLACLLGGILGDVFGFIFMPQFIAVVLEELYTLPQYDLRFDLVYGVGGVLLFLVAIVGATVLACYSELRQMPATLMRPKAPRAGSRVFLERIPFIWNRLKFLNKVTVRNLFRYKKRLFMTVGGIMGCTALILCGFAIKDSIAKLGPNQYKVVYQYDLMAVAQENAYEGLIRQLNTDGKLADYESLRFDSVKLVNSGGKSEKVQLMAIPDGASIENYIRLENLHGDLIKPQDNGVLLTRNAATILGLEAGDTILMEDMALKQHEVVVTDVVKNYLGNNVYLSQKQYEVLFGGYAPNGVLAHLSEANGQAEYAQKLLDHDAVVSAVSTAALLDEYGFDLMNAVLLLIIVMAGGLAFVVLFTLSNTNISERSRELATIKVLGFYDKEVHQYVNKETLLLTSAGILVGLPVGRFISGFLTVALNMPSIHFAVYVQPVSYLITAAITFCFAIAVNWMTNRTLNRIVMVEALKSVE
jgi:ABC-type antimicrobial peptide transport system permease subunit